MPGLESAVELPDAVVKLPELPAIEFVREPAVERAGLVAAELPGPDWGQASEWRVSDQMLQVLQMQARLRV